MQFDFATIEAATNKFSDDNKLGECGFGQVYKVRDKNSLFAYSLAVRSSTCLCIANSEQTKI